MAGGANSQIVQSLFSGGGIRLESDGGGKGPTGTVIEGNQIAGTGEGIAVDGTNISGLTVRFNQFSGGSIGIALNSQAAGTINGNSVTAVGTALAVNAAFSGSIDSNDFSGATVGVQYGAAAPLNANRINGNTIGVVSTVSDPTAALGFVAGSLPNQIYENGTGVELESASMQNQHVYENALGVTGSGSLVATDLAHANVIELNGVGIEEFSGPIEFNRVDQNTTGISAISGQFIAHDLIYRNTSTAVDIAGATSVQVISNTFYSPTGDNISVTDGASNVEIQDNVLWASSGYDIYVANDSQSGFFSDYNDLFADGTGKLVHWDIDFTDILDWQVDVNQFDLHSVGSTVVNPLSGPAALRRPGAGRLPRGRHGCRPSFHEPDRGQRQPDSRRRPGEPAEPSGQPGF